MTKWLLAALLALHIGMMPQESLAQGCAKKSVVVIADRAGGLTGDLAGAYDEGLRRIIGDRGLAGQILAIDLDVKGSGYRQLASECLEGLPDEAEIARRVARAIEQEKSWYGRIFEAAADFLFENTLAKNEKILEHRRRIEETIDAERRRRQKLYEAAKAAVQSPLQPVSDVDLLYTIASLVSERCRTEASCQFFVFSSLIDSRSRNAFSPDAADPKGLGTTHGRYLSTNLGIADPKPSISIRLWGIGRADAAGREQLTTDERRKLTEFWTAALTGISTPEIRFAYRLE